ncbi:hypothetical protein CLF_107648 [Clonorchis sinensis]|uniref:Uncharacterized protein n=1 Tax=Clonorchis sinensis TaxID=79923 RepID=G7YGZ6_CLOSI|nr:hypothetical protein CLF_107648 [Clonorchis sinensis]
MLKLTYYNTHKLFDSPRLLLGAHQRLRRVGGPTKISLAEFTAVLEVQCGIQKYVTSKQAYTTVLSSDFKAGGYRKTYETGSAQKWDAIELSAKPLSLMVFRLEKCSRILLEIGVVVRSTYSAEQQKENEQPYSGAHGRQLLKQLPVVFVHLILLMGLHNIRVTADNPENRFGLFSNYVESDGSLKPPEVEAYMQMVPDSGFVPPRDQDVLLVLLLRIVCHKPAGSFVKWNKGHFGYYKCGRCVVHGVGLETTNDFPTTAHQTEDRRRIAFES